LDHRERELRRNGESRAEVASGEVLQAAPETSPSAPKSDELLRQGEELFSMGMYDQAIHLWTRILFLERGHARAKRAIERAKRAISERQRKLDEELATAARLVEEGEVEAASAKVKHVLLIDPRISEAHQLAERIEAKQRRADSSRPAVPHTRARDGRDPSAGKRGLLLRVSGPVERDGHRRASATPLKMGGFVLGVILVFASGALYLHLNWEFIVGDDALVGGAALTPGGGALGASREAPDVPTASALHYYNGARLYAKGRYREALDELSRVRRSEPEAELARSLILRIEERLLREVVEIPESSDETVKGAR